MLISLPFELVREIIDHVLVAPPATVPGHPRTNGKVAWSSIHSLSVACKVYRTFVLEAWFRVLFMKSPVDLLFLEENLQEVRSSWTRELHCVPVYNPSNFDPWDLTGFHRLDKIRVDCMSIIVIEPRLPFLNVPSSLKELDLRGLSWPSPFVFRAVTATFPQLRTLRLNQRRIWCGLCFTCSTVGFVGAVPPKLVYREGLGLPIHYSRILSDMQHLHTVSITVPYSVGASIHLDPEDPGKDLWSGECDPCVSLMQDDTDFWERYKASKKGTLPLAGQDSNRVYIKPPALEIVEWVFWRRENDDKESGDEEEEQEADDGNEEEEEEGEEEEEEEEEQ